MKKSDSLFFKHRYKINLFQLLTIINKIKKNVLEKKKNERNAFYTLNKGNQL